MVIIFARWLLRVFYKKWKNVWRTKFDWVVRNDTRKKRKWPNETVEAVKW